MAEPKNIEIDIDVKWKPALEELKKTRFNKADPSELIRYLIKLGLDSLHNSEQNEDDDSINGMYQKDHVD